MGRQGSIADDIRAVDGLSVVPTILEAMARTTGLRFTTVARVTRDSWTACAVRDTIDFGLKPGDELPLATTLCNEVRISGQPIIFGDASVHPAYSDHPVPTLYGFQSYVSVPIVRRDGSTFGTLCALDPLPANLDEDAVLKTFGLFAQLIATHLDQAEQVVASDKLLGDANEIAALREQFIAVLGHDLRSPLQSVSMAAEMLEKKLEQPRQLAMVAMIRRSCARMSGLIDDVMDFSRGRLGGGIPVAPLPVDNLPAVLEQVVSEIRSTHPQRDLRCAVELPDTILCDARKIAQLFTNLLANAMTHGSPGHPVVAQAGIVDGLFELSVTNGGPRIPESIMAGLFQPFVRAPDRASSNGLGLGLYIAYEIARGHGGALSATSDDKVTRFVFRMPVSSARDGRA